MKMQTTTPVIAMLLRNHPRKNFPRHVAAKRGESNFVLAFGRAYTAEATAKKELRKSIPARELRVEGFGIADFIWISWQSNENQNEGSGIGIRDLKRREKKTLLAFELKISDWKKALGQAYRYRYFADAAFAVLPPRAAKSAKKFIKTFKSLEVGLWSFDKSTGVIRKFYSPHVKKPMSETARARAMASLAHRIKAQPIA
jgi:hypothetical protein